MSDNQMTFETAMARLEAIVRELEKGESTLDGSLGLFEEGIGLVKFCNSRLDQAEQRVNILVAGENGEMTEKNFIPENKD